LVVVLVFCVAGLTALSMQVRCIDAAREAARLAARGDENGAVQVARDIAPRGAGIELRHEGDRVAATVAVAPMLLPGITIRANTVAAMEPAVK
jgi:hypothetical protein